MKEWKRETNNKLRLVIELKSEKKMIGILMFKVDDHEHLLGQIGFSLNKKYQGKGFAQEAVKLLINYIFKEFALNKIVAACDLRNSASYGLMEKIGMKREAHHIEHHNLNGVWCDSYVYAILKREWKV
jgi:RimJ/RimL family protein N-acetyltransferase